MTIWVEWDKYDRLGIKLLDPVWIKDHIMLYSFPLSNSLDPSDFAIQIDSIRPISYSRDSINHIYGSLKGIHHLYEIKSRVIVERSENDKITEVNILAFIAIVLFISVPTAFLLIIYVKTVSESNWFIPNLSFYSWLDKLKGSKSLILNRW